MTEFFKKHKNIWRIAAILAALALLAVAVPRLAMAMGIMQSGDKDGEESFLIVHAPDESSDTSAAGTDVPEGSGTSTGEEDPEVSPTPGEGEDPVVIADPSGIPIPITSPTPTPVPPLAESSAKYYFYDSLGKLVESYAYGENSYILFGTDATDFSNLVVRYTSDVKVADEDIAEDISGRFTVHTSEGENISVEYEDGHSEILLFRKTSLPTVHVTLADGKTLTNVHASKSTKFENTMVVIEEDGEASVDVGDAQFKGRGNTSWRLYEKKGYQIKFDKKTSVLGMGKAKKWILLSNNSDPTMLKNAAAFDLAEGLGISGTTDYRFADLFVNGEYRGVYMITEKVEIGENRLDLSDENGIIIELDDEFYNRETYFTDDFKGRHYTLKDAEDVYAEDLFAQFEERMDIFLDLADKADADSFELLKEVADLESFAKVYLIEEYMGNKESTVTSLYFWRDGGKIYAGPVWDFDSSLDGDDEFSADERYVNNLEHFNRLLKNEEFYQLVLSVYDDNKALFDNVAEDIRQQGASLSEAVDCDQLRWNYFAEGYTDPKGTKTFTNYADAVNNAVSWLETRNSVFRGLIETQVRVSEEDGFLSIAYTDPAFTNETVRFAIWNADDGKKEWVSARSDSKGNAVSGAYMAEHGISGNMNVHAYEGNTMTSFAAFYAQGGNKKRPNPTSTPTPVPTKTPTPTPKPKTAAMFRLYNPNSGEHFYTSSAGEKNHLVDVGWNYEGVGWYAPLIGTPVYRLYNPNAGDHHYTTSVGERNSLIAVGWKDEGIGWYSADMTGVPLYRQYNPNAAAGTHNYTTSKSENDYLVSIGWRAEGIGWYGVRV